METKTRWKEKENVVKHDPILTNQQLVLKLNMLFSHGDVVGGDSRTAQILGKKDMYTKSVLTNTISTLCT